MEAYKLWVRKNRDLVRSLESLANGLTWILPERFANSEIAPEAVYALLGVVSSVNQHIIDTPTEVHSLASKEQAIPWGLVVSVLKDVEAVVEVAAQHFVGDDRKWGFLAVTEGVKAGVRLAAFRQSGYKMLLQGGEVANEEEVTVPEDNYGVNGNGVPVIYPMNGHSQNGHKSAPNGLDGKYGFVSKSLEGRAVAALNKFGQNAKMMSDPMWMRLQPTPEPPVMVLEKPKPTLASIWSAKGVSGRLFFLGEVVHIFRPLVYVLLIRKFGIRSWTPWLVSLAVELTSLGIHSHVTDLNHRGGKVLQLSSAERDELKRRKMMWALYVMRDPFFANYTKRHLQKAEKMLNPVPLIGFLTGKLMELLEGVQTRYTYTSGS
ncbi:peroxisome biogenesis protein 16-like [Phragmites australis]|uniref:peroxisome biogenesis protein 16-like n=1 Tax=Phragmites australis TaxID=29695 RepID=UPI002D77063A|nr:peroxisome biogenesis protein 16-like [Phragmites australis]